MKLLQKLWQYRGTLVNILMLLTYVFLGRSIFEMGVHLWWLIPLQILFTWAFFTKLTQVQNRFDIRKAGDDLGLAMFFLWLGHIIITAFLIGQVFYPDLESTLFLVLVSIFLMRDIAIFGKTSWSDAAPDKKKLKGSGTIFAADLILAVYSVFAYIFTWESMLSTMPERASLPIEEILVAIFLAFVMILPTQMAFIYESFAKMEDDADSLSLMFSIFGMVLGGVWVAL